VRRGLITVAAAVAVAVAGVLIVAAVSGDHDPTMPAPALGLDTRVVEAGEVDVEIEPRRLDDEAAVFAVAFDTHSVELSADLTRTATLEVDGADWPVDAWSGDGLGGHHRAGELRFRAGGPAHRGRGSR